jgi:hypothetical protein
MSNKTCRGVVDLCAIRVTRLLSSGAIDFGSDALYVSDAPISIAISDTVTTSDASMLKSGCGVKCVVKNAQPEPVSEQTLDLQLCKWDSELLEMFTGYTLLTRAGNTIGLAYPDPTSALATGCILEGWSKSYDGDQQVTTSNEQWRHHAWTKVVGTIGNRNLGEGAQAIGVNLTCTSNAAANLGPLANWPAVIQGPYADWVDTNPPSAVCGYESLQS